MFICPWYRGFQKGNGFQSIQVSEYGQLQLEDGAEEEKQHKVSRNDSELPRC